MNKGRAQDLLAEARLDALVVGSPVNVRYLTGYHWWLDGLFREYMMRPGGSDELLSNTFAALPRGGEPILVAPAFLAGNALDDADVCVEDVRLFGDVPLEVEPTSVGSHGPQLVPDHSAPGLPEVIATLVRDLELPLGRIGIEASALGSQARAALAAAVGKSRLFDSTNLVRVLRAVKSQEEIERLRLAGSIAEAGAAAMFENATSETPMADATTVFRRKVTELGANFDHVVYSLHGCSIGANPTVTLGHTSCVSVDYGCIYGGYFSDGGTTFAANNVSDFVHRRWEAVSACVERAAAEMRPGNQSSSIQRVMAESLWEDGVRQALLPHGHGLGLEVRDYPILVPPNDLRIEDEAMNFSSDMPLEEGMVVNLEASVMIPDVGSTHYEKTYLVGKFNAEPLMPQPRKLRSAS